VAISISDLQAATIQAGQRDGQARAARGGPCPVPGAAFWEEVFQDGPFTAFCRKNRVNVISALRQTEGDWARLVTAYAEAYTEAYNASTGVV
jgi:hypothetical protein